MSRGDRTLRTSLGAREDRRERRGVEREGLHYHPMIVLNPTNGFNPTLVLFMFIVADLCLLSSHKSEIQSVHSCISFLLQSHVLALVKDNQCNAN